MVRASQSHLDRRFPCRNIELGGKSTKAAALAGACGLSGRAYRLRIAIICIVAHSYAFVKA